MEEKLAYKAYAKINLTLKIFGKRADGFHEMETLMVPIEWADDLTLEQNPQFEFVCNSPGVPTDESNLVVKAVRAFENKTGIKAQCKITLIKNVPHGAGLGGGSSDAAYTLLGLNAMFEAGLNLQELSEIAAQFGSDIPFFLYQTLCLCSGRGEKIQPYNRCLNWPIVLLKPSFGVPTPEAYKHWSSSQEIKDFSYGSQQKDDIVLYNDLERPVFEKYLYLGELKNWLLNQPETEIAMMSGSGATVFATCKDINQAKALAERAKEYDSTLLIWSGKTL